MLALRRASSWLGRCIAPGDGTPDLFVHHSAIKAGGFRGRQESQRVEFTSGQGVKGPQAEEVHMI
jgi:CspA family cold shock protein